MKVAKLYSFNDIRIEDIHIPQIGSRDALIKTKACGICSGDVMPWYIEKKAPLVLGHEPVGEIVELGSEIFRRGDTETRGLGDLGKQEPSDIVAASPLRRFAPSFNVGDRVFVHHHAPCMECRHCKRGDYVQCETWRNTRIIPGGISEYILIPEINLMNDTLLLPDNVSYEDGTLIEPTACVVKSLKRANIRQGDTMLVIGLGVMGQMHILIARSLGIKKIIAADMVSFRLNKALEFGADYAIDVSKEDLIKKVYDLTGGNMADIVIVGPNSAEAMRTGIQSASRGGTVVLFTPAKPGESLSLDPNYIYFNDINIVTSYSCGPDDTIEALRFISGGYVTAEKIVTHRFPLEKTSEAFKLTSHAGESLKSIIVFD